MKKITALLCALLLLAVLAGCGSQEVPPEAVSSAQETAEHETAQETAEHETAQETAEHETAQENTNDTSAPEEQTEATAPSEGVDSSNEAPSKPQIEDFAGDYTCSTISFGKDIMPLQEGPYSLSIKGNEAVIIGLQELGTDPLTLEFEEGELYWVPPEEEVRVFTLRLMDDGIVTLTFDKIPEAPVFLFDPV